LIGAIKSIGGLTSACFCLTVPYKILCLVIKVQLKAELDTDEVFSQITLVPEAEQDESSLHQIPVPMEGFLFSGDMLMNVFHLWI
jgi:hypothetical protein